MEVESPVTAAIALPADKSEERHQETAEDRCGVVPIGASASAARRSDGQREVHAILRPGITAGKAPGGNF